MRSPNNEYNFSDGNSSKGDSAHARCDLSERMVIIVIMDGNELPTDRVAF